MTWGKPSQFRERERSKLPRLGAEAALMKGCVSTDLGGEGSTPLPLSSHLGLIPRAGKVQPP